MTHNRLLTIWKVSETGCKLITESSLDIFTGSKYLKLSTVDFFHVIAVVFEYRTDKKRTFEYLQYYLNFNYL